MEVPAKSSRELAKDIKKLKSVWSSESIITTRAVVYLCELLEKLIAQNERPKRGRALSAWQVFISKGVKEGKSLQQLAKEFRSYR